MDELAFQEEENILKITFKGDFFILNLIISFLILELFLKRCRGIY